MHVCGVYIFTCEFYDSFFEKEWRKTKICSYHLCNKFIRVVLCICVRAKLTYICMFTLIYIQGFCKKKKNSSCEMY